MLQETSNIRAYATCDSYDIKDLYDNFSKNYRTTLNKDVVAVETDNGVAFFFMYGVVVFWAFDYDFQKILIDEAAKFSKKSFEKSPCAENYSYFLSSSGITKIQNDKFEINSLDTDILLAHSYAISQSIKLSYFEDIVLKSIETSKYIPERLASEGSIKLPPKKIAKERGRLFLTKSNIHLHYQLLDTPEFFWEYPELEGYYEISVKYLDVRSRIEVLNKKLEIVQELLEMLSDEQKHRHSSALEMIIIGLIAIEIILFFFPH